MTETPNLVLEPEKQVAVEDLAGHDLGVLVAPPGAGKQLFPFPLIQTDRDTTPAPLTDTPEPSGRTEANQNGRTCSHGTLTAHTSAPAHPAHPPGGGTAAPR